MIDSKRLIAMAGALALGAATLSGDVLAGPIGSSPSPLPAATTLTNFDQGLAAGNGGFFTSADSPAALGGGLHGGVTTLLDSMVSPMTDDFSGTVSSWVYGDSVNPTQLLFAYLYTMQQTGSGPDLVRSTIGDAGNPWLGFTVTDAGSDGSGSSSDGGGTTWFDGDPNFLLRDPTGSGEGLTIQWRAQNVGTVLNETDTSALIWYLVDARRWTKTDVGLLDSGQTGKARGFAPDRVPEPASFVLLGLGLVGIGALRRRKMA